MCWICDPIGETSKTLAHVADVVQNDPTANAVVTAAALAGGAYLAAPLFTGAAATTAAEIGATSAASGAAAMVPLETVSLAGWGPVASVTAGAPAAASAATGAGLWGTLQTRSVLCIPSMKLRGLVPNFHIHVFVSDLYTFD